METKLQVLQGIAVLVLLTIITVLLWHGCLSLGGSVALCAYLL